jgi:hypothetical protein
VEFVVDLEAQRCQQVHVGLGAEAGVITVAKRTNTPMVMVKPWTWAAARRRLWPDVATGWPAHRPPLDDLAI